ncbi:MAG: hypothetical protein V1684_01525 [bacterium]
MHKINKVVADFKATNLYTKEFLTDLEDGLHKSSYAKKYRALFFITEGQAKIFQITKHYKK